MKQHLTFVESNDDAGRRRFARKRGAPENATPPKRRSRPRLAVTVREGLDLQTPTVIPDGAWAIQPDGAAPAVEPLLDIDFTQPWELSNAAADLTSFAEAVDTHPTGVWEVVDDTQPAGEPAVATTPPTPDELDQMMADDQLDDIAAHATWVEPAETIAPPKPVTPPAAVATAPVAEPQAPVEPAGPTDAELALERARVEAEQAEAARREAEAARAEAERLKVEARAARAQAQHARRAKAEAAAAKAEAERLKAEAEAARIEVERAKAESAQAAQARAEAERLKLAASEARSHAEQAEQVLAEAAAAKADAERLKAEAEAAKRQAEQAQAAANAMVRQAKADAAKARAMARAEAKAAAQAARDEAARAKAAADQERADAQRAKAEAEAARDAADRARAHAEARAAALAEDDDATVVAAPRAYRRGRASSRKRLSSGSMLGISSLTSDAFEPVAAAPAADLADAPEWPRIGEHVDPDEAAEIEAARAAAEAACPGPWNDPTQVATYSVAKMPQVTPKPSGRFRPYQASYGPAADAS